MSFSQNNCNSLMGFSVHQPSIGAPLQFFPPMGSKQLDDMIDAYVPGNASILDKRTTVTFEFAQHSISTGELFKFFMVYPSQNRMSDSSGSPASLQSSEYDSFNTSPVMSESQWTSTPSSSGSKASSASKKLAASDFSHIPGMKIMTRDGIDVTNSASRGCKTKEQRDHAHLMRIIKACDSCRRKKIRCDPNHKKRTSPSQSPEPKVSKKARKSPIAAKVAKQVSLSNEAATFAPMPLTKAQDPLSEANDPSEWMSTFDSFVTANDEVDIFAEMENWDQFINYGDESAAVQGNYDFNADQFSPTTTFTNSTSSSQLFTPGVPGLGSGGFGPASVGDFTASGSLDYVDAFANGELAPALPYLNPGGVEAGTNYVDFNLYSPSSSQDEDLEFFREITAASPRQEGFDHIINPQIDRPHDRAREHRHKSQCNSFQADTGEVWNPLHQSTIIMEASQAAALSQETMASPTSSLHGRSRSSPKLGLGALQSTGLTRPNKRCVPPSNQHLPSLMPPYHPDLPLRPCGDEDKPHSSRATIQPSEPVFVASPVGVFGPTQQASLETSAISSQVSLDSPATKNPRSEDSPPSTGTVIGKWSRRCSKCDHQHYDYHSQTLAVMSEQLVVNSSIMSILDRRAPAAPLPASTELSTRTWRTYYGRARKTVSLVKDTRRLPTQIVQSKPCKTDSRKSHYRRASVIADSQESLGNGVLSIIVVRTGVLAAIGRFSTALYDAKQGIATSSDATILEPSVLCSLSAVIVLWSMSDCFVSLGGAQQTQPYRSSGTGPDRENQSPLGFLSLPEALAVKCCLTALLVLVFEVMIDLKLLPLLVLAVPMALCWNLPPQHADKPGLSVQQPLSSAKKFTRTSLISDVLGTRIHDISSWTLSHFQSNMERISLPVRSSPKAARGGRVGGGYYCWQRPLL